MKLRIVTWNINSVRLRFALLRRFVDAYDPDILCLQEIKCRDELFPHIDARALGFSHISVCGQAGYHGVATLSKLPLLSLPRQSFCGTSDARHLGTSIAIPGSSRTVAVHNIYVPAGGDIPDPELNPKFKQKLAYLKALKVWSEPNSEDRILLGDFNIAPLETDVWSHRQLLQVVSHTPIEVDHLAEVQTAGRWMDVVRKIIPPEEKLYSWWSYRARDWAASDRGRRLDHIWISGSLAPFARDVTVLKEARSWPGPSDHVPVIADFVFDG